MVSKALITTIEGNGGINNIKLGWCRDYESEAIKCFNEWRKNAGELKDIDIYCYCFTKNIISEKTKKKLEKLNVKYIEHFINETDSYECGFWNIPLLLKYAKEKLNYDWFIKIDLDMYLTRPLPPHLFEYETSCGRYTFTEIFNRHNNFKDIVIKSGIDFWDTGLVIYDKNSTFSELFYKYCKKLTDLHYNNKLLDYINSELNINIDKIDFDIIEELACIFVSKEIPIKSVYNYALGTYQDPIHKVKKENLKNICFNHYHLGTNE
ncbi:TPA: hypothetical protein SB263_001500 [Campylobacter coli]|nr:hypothetical protein [Campylobacter coli]